MNLFDTSNMENELSKLEAETLQEGFWNDSKNSSIILKKIKTIKNKLEKYKKLNNELDGLIEMSELVIQEETDESASINSNQDNSLAKDILLGTKQLQTELDSLEIQTLLSGKYDMNNAIVTIHPGARWNRISRLG